MRPAHTTRIRWLLALAGATALPATAAPGPLEELLVTAQKREENLQDVAVGVTLVSGKALANAHLRNAEELTRLAPTLNVQASSGPSTASFNIRGIGTQAFSPAVEPSVLTMLDGVTMGRSGMAFIDLVDIERVEILRGPQGTLYGKNASGGVIHIITRDPTPETGGTLRATAIEDDEYRLAGTLSGPVTNTLSYRLTGALVDDDGYAENVANGNTVNGTDNHTLRGKLLWQPTETWALQWSSDYSESDCECTALGVREIRASNSQQALIDEQFPVVPGHDNQDVNNDQPTYVETEASGHALTVEYEGAAHRLTSITAYRDWDNTGIVDLDNRPNNPLALGFPMPPRTQQEQWSQELRLTSTGAGWGNYVIGAFYFDQDVDTDSVVTTALFAPILPPTTRISSTDVQGENMALFGELNIDISAALQLTLGARYTEEELGYRTVNIGTDNLIFGPEGEVSDSLDDQNTSTKLALKWNATDTLMLYASYVEGFKGPAFDTNLSAGGSFVRPETSDAFELGLKSSWFDGRLVLNVAAFHAQYDNFQAQALIDLDLDDMLPAEFLLINAGEVSTRGVEIEFIAQPTGRWNLSGGYAYTDDEIDEFPGGNCSQGQIFRGECPEGAQDLSGGQLPYTPRWKLNLGATYTVPIADGAMALEFGADMKAQDDVLYEISQDPFTRQSGYTVVDAHTALSAPDDGYRVSVFVKNVFDEDYATLIFAHAQELIPHGYIHHVPKYARRTAGVEFAYTF